MHISIKILNAHGSDIAIHKTSSLKFSALLTSKEQKSASGKALRRLTLHVLPSRGFKHL